MARPPFRTDTNTDVGSKRTAVFETPGGSRMVSGFTIVELLIVIVVIAILAAVIIVAYNGITRQAIESSMKSDLRNSATALELGKTTNGTYPVSEEAARAEESMRESPGNTLSYARTSDGYCLSVSNAQILTPLRLIGPDATISSGSCTSSKAGTKWTVHAAAEQDVWRSVAYGNGQFVAIADADDRAMTSPDGITWTANDVPLPDEQNGGCLAFNVGWTDVIYGGGEFVAVGHGCSGNAMTSPDGITWTRRETPPSNGTSYLSVAYGNARYVAVGPNAIMTSPDGVTWSSATAPTGAWKSVAYGNGTFVAIAYGSDGIDRRVMTSADGISWTQLDAPEQNLWFSVAYGGGRFVSIAATGTHRLMTSTSGTDWILQDAPANQWTSITHGGERFVAVSGDGTNQIMFSDDGLTWSTLAAPEKNSWMSVTYGEGCFVAVAGSGSNRVMRSCE